MSMSDPIADMLTRIRNAALAGQKVTTIPGSKLKSAIAQILVDEGYIEGFELIETDGPQPVLRVNLKYVGERRKREPVISGLRRVSKPGRRVYTNKREIPRVLQGMGIAILSTPKGVMTGRKARSMGVGGEVLCHIW